MSKNAEVAAKLAARIKQQVERGANKGLEAGLIFLGARVREMMSVPAPRKRVKDAGGNISYRATTRATPGAPIRKLSGKARASVTTRMVGPNHGILSVKARSVKGFNYPRAHELRTGHAFIAPTVAKYKRELMAIIGKGIKGAFK